MGDRGERLIEIDITYSDLSALLQSWERRHEEEPSLGPIPEAMHKIKAAIESLWVKGVEIRKHRVRIGTLRLWVDEDGHLWMSFRSRFDGFGEFLSPE